MSTSVSTIGGAITNTEVLPDAATLQRFRSEDELRAYLVGRGGLIDTRDARGVEIGAIASNPGYSDGSQTAADVYMVEKIANSFGSTAGEEGLRLRKVASVVFTFGTVLTPFGVSNTGPYYAMDVTVTEADGLLTARTRVAPQAFVQDGIGDLHIYDTADVPALVVIGSGNENYGGRPDTWQITCNAWRRRSDS